jgi:carboxypeptidase Q
MSRVTSRLSSLLLVLLPAMSLADASPAGSPPVTPSAPAPAGASSPASRLLARLQGPTPVLEDLRELTDDIGGRPTGSPAVDRAVKWAAAKLRAAGVDVVRVEPYQAKAVWVPRVERAEIRIGGDDAPLRPAHVAGMPFAASTGPGGLEAEVVDVGQGDEAGFAAAGARAHGRWVLVHSEPMKSFEDLFMEYMVMPGVFQQAQAAGAVGVLYISNRDRGLLYRHNAAVDGSTAPVPGVMLERETGLKVARSLAAGERVRVRATIEADARRDAPASNVVGEIRGGERPNEVVILGAHLDSWELGDGANDNGCNAALVIDVARQAAIEARTRRPRRTLRFILYTGEEAGLFGSMADVRAHRDSLDSVQADVVIDTGSGRLTGFSLGGREDLRAGVAKALADVAGLGPFEQTTDAFIGTDNYDYLVEGVPNLVANQEAPPYLPDYHAESDTFDKVDEHELKANEAIVGVLVWNLADMQGRLAPRQSRSEVEALVAATGLDTQMKTFGLWDDFVSGKRGRQP